ncbi:hypothetical protein U9M48_008895 [Paspalum notatum var. saurae]|uniref:Uncharacterized protein n=1 Tax=Paspalum notatum var. saurae TaxID=547442 RepID=A0AAQ3SQ07_PASNO
MAKPSAVMHTPRPYAIRSSSSSCPATRSTAGSTSSSAAVSELSVASSTNTKVVAKCLTYDDIDVIQPAASTLLPEATPEEGITATEDDLASLLELPDPDVSGDEVAARAGSISTDDGRAASLPEEISVVLAELRGARGLSPRSKRILSALAETAAFELAPPAATARCLRRTAFWGKVRVAVLSATLATLAAVDIALAAYIYARRVNDRYHVLPPT